MKKGLNGFETEILPIKGWKRCPSVLARWAKIFDCSHFKLSKALAQVHLGNTSQKLLNEIRQKIFFCTGLKKLLKKCIKIW